MGLKLIVEAHVPDQDAIGKLLDTGISIRLGLDFDQAGTNSVMTHVVVFAC